MRLSGYQPHYFPRLHYVKRALDSDVFEVSDYLQFVKKHQFTHLDGTSYRDKSYQAHASVKLQNGTHYLVVPTKDSLQAINQTPIVYNPDWVSKHLETIKVAYRNASQFNNVYPEVEAMLSEKYNNLADLTIRTVLWSIIRMVTDQKITDLHIDALNRMFISFEHPFRLRSVVIASQLGVPYSPGHPSEWIISLCHKVQATEYYTGGSAMTAYMEPALFKREGITVTVQDWSCPFYVQCYPRAGFLSNLSALDLIMNVPIADRQKVMMTI